MFPAMHIDPIDNLAPGWLEYLGKKTTVFAHFIYFFVVSRKIDEDNRKREERGLQSGSKKSGLFLPR